MGTIQSISYTSQFQVPLFPNNELSMNLFFYPFMYSINVTLISLSGIIFSNAHALKNIFII